MSSPCGGAELAVGPHLVDRPRLGRHRQVPGQFQAGVDAGAFDGVDDAVEVVAGRRAGCGRGRHRSAARPFANPWVSDDGQEPTVAARGLTRDGPRLDDQHVHGRDRRGRPGARPTIRCTRRRPRPGRRRCPPGAGHRRVGGPVCRATAPGVGPRTALRCDPCGLVRVALVRARVGGAQDTDGPRPTSDDRGRSCGSDDSGSVLRVPSRPCEPWSAEPSTNPSASSSRTATPCPAVRGRSGSGCGRRG